MATQIALITLVVDDYDKAILYYSEKLGFVVKEDTPLSETKRWVRVGPSSPGGCDLLLAKAVNSDQFDRVGNQTGGRVSFFLYTDNFREQYEKMAKGGIQFISEPRAESYGLVVVFEDLYGNRWDLIGPPA